MKPTLVGPSGVPLTGPPNEIRVTMTETGPVVFIGIEVRLDQMIFTAHVLTRLANKSLDARERKEAN